MSSVSPEQAEAIAEELRREYPGRQATARASRLSKKEPLCPPKNGSRRETIPPLQFGCMDSADLPSDAVSRAASAANERISFDPSSQKLRYKVREPISNRWAALSDAAERGALCSA